MKRKRSTIPRKPRANSDTLFQSYFGWLSHTEPFDKQVENENVRDTMVASDGLGTGNKPKKLKLKLGGVTHTIHAKSKMETGFGCGSHITNFSPCSDGPKSQDDADGNDACPFDNSRGLGDKLVKLSRTESGFTEEEHSHRGKATGQNINVNHEHVSKRKRITKGCVLDVGFSDEDNEDAELHFLQKFSASKRAVSRHKDNPGGTAMYGTCKVAERSQVDDPNSIKDGKKKLNSEKKYEDQDYVEEDPTSSDESISERKKAKRESVDLLVRGEQCGPITRSSVDSSKHVLSGSDASIIDISDGLVPALSKSKKGKLSEMEQQLKKAEAAKKRKIQSEKAAKEAEEAAIRKILGQESARKKKEEKMNKRRDELAKEKSSKSFNLGSSTIRWTMGPEGTVVTFSEDIGLPSIFQTIPNRLSYPPPREKCAGPNCTNVYKYRDSKSKLPLCSLGCYRAIDEKNPTCGCMFVLANSRKSCYKI